MTATTTTSLPSQLLCLLSSALHAQQQMLLALPARACLVCWPDSPCATSPMALHVVTECEEHYHHLVLLFWSSFLLWSGSWSVSQLLWFLRFLQFLRFLRFLCFSSHSAHASTTRLVKLLCRNLCPRLLSA